jgi:hypothetical protein
VTSTMTATVETAVPTRQTWAIDPSHTQVGFAVKHLMITNVKGRFQEVTGSISLDPSLPNPASTYRSARPASPPEMRSGTSPAVSRPLDAKPPRIRFRAVGSKESRFEVHSGDRSGCHVRDAP